MLALVTLPFYLHQSLGLSIATAGYCLTPWPLALVAMAPLAGKLSDRFSAGRLGGSGLLLVAAGLLLLAQLKPGAAIPDILWRMALCGAGFGCFQSPNNRLIILSSPVDRTSAAGAMIGTVRLTGQLTGASAGRHPAGHVGPLTTTGSPCTSPPPSLHARRQSACRGCW